MTPIFLGLAVLCAYLFLVALYESWSMPIAVLLWVTGGVVVGAAGAVDRRAAERLYAQVGIVALIGLASKNGILIVEFAMEEPGPRHPAGRSERGPAAKGRGVRRRRHPWTGFFPGCDGVSYRSDRIRNAAHAEEHSLYRVADPLQSTGTGPGGFLTWAPTPCIAGCAS